MTHGTVSTYKRHKCRCDECRAANRIYAAGQRAKHRTVETGEQKAARLDVTANRASYWKREAEEARALAHYWKLRALQAERK